MSGGDGERGWLFDPADLIGGGILFAASIARLVHPLAGRESFGVEPTLALLTVLALVYAASSRVTRRLRAPRTSREARGAGDP